ncbi:MAG: D-2-hydroxyacid dehydrogenase [Acidobacteria bacterium]|nr:MAG: D-2-hydroxyacid dehydrogenase [Acidobacteriota bacterium]
MNVLIFTVWPVEFWRVPKSQVERLRERFPHVTFTHAVTDAEAMSGIESADVALASRLSASMVEHAPRLRWVHSTAAAVGILPLKELAAREILVTNSRGVQAPAMAEFVIGGLLVLARRFHLILAAQRERRWIQNELTRDVWPWSVRGRTMTIVGLGTIGQEVARRAHAFGMRVIGIRRRMDQPKPSFVDRIAGPEELDGALRGCDVLVIAAPFISETDRLIGSERLAMLKRGAIVINVARGQIIDEMALIQALDGGHLGGAVLDVFRHEPLDPASPLWTFPNVIISPHVSGVRSDHWDEVIDLFSENLRRFERGDPLLNPVDVRAGY